MWNVRLMSDWLLFITYIAYRDWQIIFTRLGYTFKLGEASRDAAKAEIIRRGLKVPS